MKWQFNSYWLTLSYYLSNFVSFLYLNKQNNGNQCWKFDSDSLVKLINTNIFSNFTSDIWSIIYNIVSI